MMSDVASVQHAMRDVVYEEIKDETHKSAPVWKTSVIEDVEVDVEIKVGTVTVKIDELFSWKKGSVIQLNNYINSPVDIVLNKKTIGKGLLVACGDYYGVEIIDILE
ncbi:FliM/FliN family flagellar motor switch protein [Vibrio sp. MEBiC08052]|uniref:FliM/FliN family flagellar motor switch protein n=1 Tax=Vibrio sp. MEBiC08052 TaxID=1761910 RepID=UPI0007405BE9|nr:FliM/FliN family flagellar motor switch protein [Vibrio sp. MEBiC08052]KUI97011.1 hypothetical protein VRK_38660 [Vibrio sp. MEBiC08052]